MKTRNKVPFLACLTILLVLPRAIAAQATSDVLLQGFYWNVHPGDSAQATTKGVWWDTLATVASKIGDAGFETVWFPQPGKGFAGVQDMGYGPYDYFDLGEHDQKGTIRTRFGTTAELAAAISALQDAGLRTMVDIVAGHRAGADFAAWNQSFLQAYDCHDVALPDSGFTFFMPASMRFPADSTHFHPNSHQGPFPNGHCNLTPPFHDAVFFEDVCYFHGEDQLPPPGGWFFGPHNLGHVGDSLVVHGRWLVDEVGFDDVRLDAVRHIEPGFMAPFLVELNSGDQPFAVGEFFDADMAAVIDWHNQVEAFNGAFGSGGKNADLAMFDFNLRYALRDMANDQSGAFDMWTLNNRGLRQCVSGSADFSIGCGIGQSPLEAADIVTFVENHDVDRIGLVYAAAADPDGVAFGASYLKQSTDSGHDPVVTDKVMAYAYIMAAEGRPMVFWKDYWDTWYDLSGDIDWLMSLRTRSAGGASTPIASLNPSFDTEWHGGDLHVLRRDGDPSTSGGLLVLNDRSAGSGDGGVWVDTPFTSAHLKDYSDRFMFETREVFADGRANLRADARDYAWYAPTGLYPQPPGEVAPAFALEAVPGGALHFVVLRAEDVANFLVNGAPIEPGDQVAIAGPSMVNAAGLGRVGQGVQWDGVHDVLIEVLGNTDGTNDNGRLKAGDPLQLLVYDQSAGAAAASLTTTFAPVSSALTFGALRPASRSNAINISTTATDSYVAGGISQITAFEVDQILPTELTDLQAIIHDDDIHLSWTLASSARFMGFEVQRVGRQAEWIRDGWVDVVRDEEPRRYAYRTAVTDGVNRLRLKMVLVDGGAVYSWVVAAASQVRPGLTMHIPVPNPVIQSAAIQFSVGEQQRVRIALYDAIGRRVRVLLDEEIAGGESQTLTLIRDGLPAGVYILRMRGASTTVSRKLVLTN